MRQNIKCIIFILFSIVYVSKKDEQMNSFCFILCLTQCEEPDERF